MIPFSRPVSRNFKATVAVAAAALATLAVAPSALALTFAELDAEPVDTQAGANSDFNMHVEFGEATDDVHDIRIGLPPGQIGDPSVTPKCTLEQFNGLTGCPAETQVGSVVTTVNLLSLPIIDLPVNGKLFNLVANPGEPARFGIILSLVDPLPVGQIKLQSAVELRQDDFGLDTIIAEIPNTASGLPIDVTAMDVTLFGDSPAFSRNPTSCGEATTTFEAHAYPPNDAELIEGSASYTPTGCENVPFSPEFSARAGAPGQTAPVSLTPVTTVIEQDDGEAGLLTAEVLTPIDFGPNLAALQSTCLPADFQAGTCTQGIIGDALATSPLLENPLTGPVILITNEFGTPDVGLDLKGELALKLKGTLALNNQVTFDDLPDIPIAHFELGFDGPPNGLLFANRDLCQGSPPVFTGDFTAHSGATLPFAEPTTIEGCTAGGPAAAPSKAAAKCKKKGRKKGKAGKGKGGKSDASTSKRKKQKKCKKKGRKKRKGKK